MYFFKRMIFGAPKRVPKASTQRRAKVSTNLRAPGMIDGTRYVDHFDEVSPKDPDMS